jgi:hypothetical protein
MPYGINRQFSECGACGHPTMAHFGGGCSCGCRAGAEVRAPLGDDLFEALRQRVSGSHSPSSPAWERAAQASACRREGQPERAVNLAREGKALADTVEEETALSCVEVAALCDLSRDEEARRVGESALSRQGSPYLLRALGRAWWLGFTATHGLEEFRLGAEECFQLAESWHPRGTVTTAA